MKRLRRSMSRRKPRPARFPRVGEYYYLEVFRHASGKTETFVNGRRAG